MECYDAGTHVYYLHHEEYVGPRLDLTGRCVRCHEVTDHAAAAAADRERAAQATWDAAYSRWMEDCDSRSDRELMRKGNGHYGRCPDRVYFSRD